MLHIATLSIVAEVISTTKARYYYENIRAVQVLTLWIHGGVSIPTAKDTVCDYKVLCYLYMVMATDIYG
jgi:hypothetical protein